jgi:peptidoglycan/LPS O-acetylase OafA/YrhL
MLAGDSRAGPGGSKAPADRFVVGDAVRGLAAAAVVLYHCAYTVTGGRPYGRQFPAPLGQILTNLDLGLFVFFALSGYLITRPFVRAYVDGSPSPSLRRYARNRLLRIVPLFWVVLTVVLLRHLVVNDTVARLARHDGAASIVLVYAFGQNYKVSYAAYLLMGQAWTLDLEAMFYLAVPVAAFLILRRRPWPLTRAGRTWAVLAASATTALVSVAIRAAVPHTVVWSRSFPTMLVAFTPGIALAALEAPLRRRLATRRDLGPLIGPVVLVCALLAALLYHLASPNRFGFDPNNPAIRVLLASLVGGLVVASPLLGQWAGRGRWPILDSRPMRHLGAWSYGLYLWHIAVILEFQHSFDSISNHSARLAVLFAAVLPTTLALAALTYYLVEVPFLKLRRARPVGTPTIDDQVAPAVT